MNRSEIDKRIKGRVYTFKDGSKKRWNGKRFHRVCKCEKSQPLFGHIGNKATRCSSCKDKGMVNLISPKCVICKKIIRVFLNTIQQSNSYYLSPALPI